MIIWILLLFQNLQLLVDILSVARRQVEQVIGFSGQTLQDPFGGGSSHRVIVQMQKNAADGGVILEKLHERNWNDVFPLLHIDAGKREKPPSASRRLPASPR